jgi:hypothetical protein
MDRDEYDLAHEATGSGNISKATIEWREALRKAREPSSEGGDFVLHRAYAAINRQAREEGTAWSKCANCGSPYIVREGGNMTTCSEKCSKDYIAYLSNPFPSGGDDW